jgi:hypothetical protein
MKNKKSISSLLVLLISIVSVGQKEIKKLPFATSSPVKYTVELNTIYTTKSWDGGDDYQEELYGAISVCLAAAGYPQTVQLDYTYKNPVDKEVAGGVEPLAAQSTNTNGRILWRQSDSKSDRRIFLDSKTWVTVAGGYQQLKHGKFIIESRAVFLFDPKKDPYAAFRLFADMWESDPSDDDEHFNAGRRKISVPLSEIPVGSTKTYTLEIFDSSSRHFASIIISAVKE